MTTSREYELLLSSISHEIRNPVTLINSYLQLMGTLHPEVKSFQQWEPIQSEMEYLKQLLARISAYHNCARLHPEATDMNQWMGGYADSAKVMVKSLTDAVFFYQPCGVLPIISVDRSGLRQVLDNLIRNSGEAVSGSGSITLSAVLQESRFCIQIKDTGPGIPNEYMDTLFDPFTTHKSGGSGLGLAIAKRITEAHGGTLTVISSPGCGAEFTVSLPV